MICRISAVAACCSAASLCSLLQLSASRRECLGQRRLARQGSVALGPQHSVGGLQPGELVVP